MEQLFRDIQTQIENEVPEIAWIDIDENQLEAFGEDAPVDYPCLLVGFPFAQFTSAGGRSQIAEIEISIKVAFKLWEKFNTKVPNRDVVFAHYVILKKVMKALQGLGGTKYNGLFRVSMSKSQSIDPKIYEIRYKCGYRDFDVMPSKSTHQVENLSISQFEN
jgi:hypothetical protein